MVEMKLRGVGRSEVDVSPDSQSDARIIEASKSDPTRFGVLFERYGDLLYRYAHRRVGPDLAEDVVADTFEAAFRVRGRYDSAYPVARPWLFGILTRELASRHRQESARFRAMSRLDAEPVAPQADGSEQVIDQEVARAARGRLAAALAALPSRYREVLLLVTWAECSYEEAAQALGLPIGTVRSRLNRARSQVKAALGGTNPLHAGEL